MANSNRQCFGTYFLIIQSVHFHFLYWTIFLTLNALDIFSWLVHYYCVNIDKYHHHLLLPNWTESCKWNFSDHSTGPDNWLCWPDTNSLSHHVCQTVQFRQIKILTIHDMLAGCGRIFTKNWIGNIHNTCPMSMDPSF